MSPTRPQLLTHLRTQITSQTPIIGAGAGTGLSALSALHGGIDLIIIYNSGRFRMAGRGSLAGLMPYGDANGIVREMGREVLPLVAEHCATKAKENAQGGEQGQEQWEVPVLAGVCGTDPFRAMHGGPGGFLAEIRDQGFAGVQNFPTVGLIDGVFRANLEETGMGYEKEVGMIGEARKLGLLTAPYVFDKQQAVRMAEVGADILVCHMGLTTSGNIGAKTGKTLEECVGLIQEMRDAVVQVNPQVIVLCHGGPIAEPKDAEFVFSRTRGVHGFFGASSMERLPVETAIRDVTREFKGIRLRGE